MSFILDALKKSETDRQRQNGPALFEVRAAPPRNPLPPWAIGLGALLAVNLVIVAWVLLRHSSSSDDKESSAAAVQAQQQSPPAHQYAQTQPYSYGPGGIAPQGQSQQGQPWSQQSGPPQGYQQGNPQQWNQQGAPQQWNQGGPQAQQSPQGMQQGQQGYNGGYYNGPNGPAQPAGGTAPSGPMGQTAGMPPGSPSLNTAPQTAQNATGQAPQGNAGAGGNPDDYAPATDPPPPSPFGNHVTRATPSGVPLYSDVSMNMHLPTLRLDLHVFAANPPDRFVMINMHKLHEGDPLPAEGVRVESITPDGAILNHSGTRFLLTKE
jgi:general secretion pathway protein B